jgi:hypothetical protein
MMRYHVDVKILILFLVLLCRQGLFAQADTDSVRIDTVRNKYLPTAMRFGTDIISLVRTRAQDNFHGWEVNGEIDFSRYFLSIDYGTWGRDLRSDGATYANTGDYWRAGIDVNFLKNDPDRNVFFLGARYGRSTFTESMTIERQDPTWGLLTDNFYHSNVNAWWLELTTGLRVKIWKIFWVGYTGRFKFGLTTDASEEMLPHDIPGFGSNAKETTWGFNYYLMLRIPLRNTPPPPADKK